MDLELKEGERRGRHAQGFREGGVGVVRASLGPVVIRTEEEIFVPVLVKGRVGVHKIHRRVAKSPHFREDIPLIADLRLDVRIVDHHGGDGRYHHADAASEELRVGRGGLGVPVGVRGRIERLRVDPVSVDEETVREEVRALADVVRRRGEVHAYGQLGDVHLADDPEIVRRAGHLRRARSDRLDVDAAGRIDGNRGDALVRIAPVYDRAGRIRGCRVGIEHGPAPDGQIDGLLRELEALHFIYGFFRFRVRSGALGVLLRSLAAAPFPGFIRLFRDVGIRGSRFGFVPAVFSGVTGSDLGEVRVLLPLSAVRFGSAAGGFPGVGGILLFPLSGGRRIRRGGNGLRLLFPVRGIPALLRRVEQGGEECVDGVGGVGILGLLIFRAFRRAEQHEIVLPVQRIVESLQGIHLLREAHQTVALHEGIRNKGGHSGKIAPVRQGRNGQLGHGRQRPLFRLRNRGAVRLDQVPESGPAENHAHRAETHDINEFVFHHAHLSDQNRK